MWPHKDMGVLRTQGRVCFKNWPVRASWSHEPFLKLSRVLFEEGILKGLRDLILFVPTGLKFIFFWSTLFFFSSSAFFSFLSLYYFQTCSNLISHWVLILWLNASSYIIFNKSNIICLSFQISVTELFITTWKTSALLCSTLFTARDYVLPLE